MLVLKHLLPVPNKRTFDLSSRPWTYQNPFPVSPICPKSWAQSSNKKALCSLQIFWYALMSGESESIEKSPSVTTKIASSGFFYLTYLSFLVIYYWLRCSNLWIFLVDAFAPYWRQLCESLSIIMWSCSLIKPLITPKPASHPAE